MTTLYLVEGTWGGEWARDRSAGSFRWYLTSLGFNTILVPWSTDADGLPSFLDATGNSDWSAGGLGMRLQLKGIPYEDRNVLTHSLGLAPALYAATGAHEEIPPVQIRRLLSICPPPRKDLEVLAQHAITGRRIGHWRNVYAQGWDLMARLGQAFDGHWGWRRTFDIESVAGVFNQVGEKGIGHSGMFTGELRQRFVDGGHVDFLHGRTT